METERTKGKAYDYRQGYVTDNLARQAAEPLERPDVVTKPRPSIRPQSEPLIGIRKRMSFLNFAVAIAGVLMVAYLLYGYVKVRAQITEIDKEIIALNNEYANMYRTNDEREEQIADSVDLNHVYEVAVGQYGMVFPNNNEIIHFTYKNDGYVRQYMSAEPKEETADSRLDDFLGKLFR